MLKLVILAILLLFLTTASVTAPAADERLAQKVTYDAGYKRLHSVADDLNRMTGVDINCGSNSRDWHVRDIPLTVYAKDIPLGRLLQALADSTHTLLVTRKTDDEKKPGYRIYRDKKLENEVSGPLEQKRSAKFAEADWAWDALTRFGSLCESAPNKGLQYGVRNDPIPKLTGTST